MKTTLPVLVLLLLILPGLAYTQAVTTEKATLVVGHQPFTPTWSSDIVRLLGADFLLRQKLIEAKPDVETWVEERYLQAARR